MYLTFYLIFFPFPFPVFLAFDNLHITRRVINFIEKSRTIRERNNRAIKKRASSYFTMSSHSYMRLKIELFRANRRIYYLCLITSRKIHQIDLSTRTCFSTYSVSSFRIAINLNIIWIFISSSKDWFIV